MSVTKVPVEDLSGTDLDRAVASEVMGWAHVEGDPFEARPTSDALAQPLRCYSSEMDVAWDVVEHIDCGDWWGFSLTAMASPAEGRYWEAKWKPMDDFAPVGPITAFGDTAPEAICRAALKAVRSTNEGA